MKKLFIILSTVSILLASCAKTPEPITPKTAFYLGTVSVFYEGEDFNNENINVNFTPSEDGKTASITIHKIRFVPAMPLTVDVTIPNIELKYPLGGGIELKCDYVIPLALGGEYPKKPVSNLTGTLSADAKTLTFSLNFGTSPTRFSGTIIE